MKRMFLRLITLVLLLSPLFTMAQGLVVRGLVTDDQGPLIGATVALYNKDNRVLTGITTNLDGEYVINVPAGQTVAKVVFSYIGYSTQSVKYIGQSAVNVELVPDMELLDEVLVEAAAIKRDGMGISEKALGGSRQRVDVTELQEMAATSVGDMLQGKIAGMDLIAGSGAPGAKMSIRIRGASSLNASNEPLIVIDDIPRPDIAIQNDFDFATATEDDFGSLVNMSPADIETIDVLKDASATAIYGARAANGVLLIKTRTGRKGKPSFEISQKVSTSIEPTPIPLLSSKEYITLMQDALWNNVRDNEYGNMNILTQYNDIRYNPNYKYFNEFNQEVDWLDYLVRTPINSETSFNMSGGGDKVSYNFSLSYLTDTGTTVGEDFSRITSRMNVDYVFSNQFKISTKFSYAESDRNSSYSYGGSPRSIAREKMPNLTPFVLDEHGNFTDEYFFQPKESIQGTRPNPIALANEAKSNAINRNGNINFYADYTPRTDLRFTGTLSFDIGANQSKSFLPVSATGVAMSSSDYNKSSESMSESNTVYGDLGVQYWKSFGKRHYVHLSSKVITQQSASSNYSASSYGNPHPNLGDPANNGNLIGVGAGESENRNLSFVQSVLYTFNRRVNAHFALRSEGSSKTGRDSRWKSFPSVSLSWNVQDEPFLDAYGWISDLKPRVSWGIVGVSPTGNSTYAGVFEALDSQYGDLTAVRPASMQMNNLRWEMVHTRNFGLDLGLFEDKLRFVLDVYNKTSYDLLQQNMKIQSTTGYTSIPWFNDGSIENKGWELYISGNRFVNYGDFSVSASFNISRNENIVLELPMNQTYQEPEVKNGKYANKVLEDRPLGSFFGFNYLGVYQNIDETYARDQSGNVIKNAYGENVITRVNGSFRQRPGDAKYNDVNYDGIIDKYDVVYLGNAQPLFIGGASLTLMYKGLMLRVSSAYRVGQSVVNQTLMNAENMSSGNNQAPSVLRRWRYEGDDTEIPRALWGENYNSLGSDRYVEDASFLKIKDITLSYRFSTEMARKMRLKGLYVYLTSYDPFTFTNYKGQDPEVSMPSGFNQLAMDNSLSPRTKKFALGLRINF